MSEKVYPLTLYDAACRALAEVVRVDEVKEILNKVAALEAYARQAKDPSMMEAATVVRLRAEHRAGEILREMVKNRGAVPGKTGHKGKPVLDSTPKLSDLGISKSQSSRWQRLARLEPEQFEHYVLAARKRAAHANDEIHRQVRQREARAAAYEARVKDGCTVDDLSALAAKRKFPVIYVDAPSRYSNYSGEDKKYAAERYYGTMAVDPLKAMGPVVRSLAAKDCALLYWTSGPQNANALDIITAWEFEYVTWEFVWVKTNRSSGTPELEDLRPKDLHWGNGWTTRPNAEVVLLARRGSPMRLANDVHQVVIAPAMGHSEKPEEVRHRIERLFGGPYLELFGRRVVPCWTVWGNEIPREQFLDAAE